MKLKSLLYLGTREVDGRKVSVIIEHAKKYNCKTFIETGTYFGATPFAVRNVFDEIYTIELDPWLYEKSLNRLGQYSNITCILGNSAEVLKWLRVDQPALYWLDAHYTGGLTAKSPNPLIWELTSIPKESVILIDDARCLGTEDYPTISYIKNLYPGMEIKDDIIRLVPPEESE